MKKIMFVIPSLRDGGAERVITRLSAAMAEMEYEVHVLEFFRPASGYELSGKVRLHSMFATEDEYNRAGFWQRNRLMRRCVVEHGPDVIIPFLEYVCQKTQLALAGTAYFRRILVTLRVTPTIGSAFHKLRRTVSIALARACIAQTGSQREYLPAFLRKKTFVIANPMDKVEPPFEENAERFTFVAAGRLVAQKNYAMMIKAFAQVAGQRDAYLKIYGRGNQSGELSGLINELGVSGRAELMGYTDNIIAEYRKANVFLLTSNWEGMPNSLMEAMALGMPCISTDCPTGPAELIRSGENGLLIPMDDEDALVGAMLEMIDDPARRLEIGQAARRSIQSGYGISQIVDKWTCAFETIGLL